MAALPRNPKGNPLEVARFAGIQAAKQTSTLIPMCHPLTLSFVDVQAQRVVEKVIPRRDLAEHAPDAGFALIEECRFQVPGSKFRVPSREPVTILTVAWVLA